MWYTVRILVHFATFPLHFSSISSASGDMAVLGMVDFLALMATQTVAPLLAGLAAHLLLPTAATSNASSAVATLLYHIARYRLHPVGLSIHRRLSYLTAYSIVLHSASIEVIWTMRWLGYVFVDDSVLSATPTIPVVTSFGSAREWFGSGELVAVAFAVQIGVAVWSPSQLRCCRRAAFHSIFPFVILATLSYHGLSYFTLMVTCGSICLTIYLLELASYGATAHTARLMAARVYWEPQMSISAHSNQRVAAPVLVRGVLGVHSTCAAITEEDKQDGVWFPSASQRRYQP